MPLCHLNGHGLSRTLPKYFHTYFPFLSLPSLSVSSDHDPPPDQPQRATEIKWVLPGSGDLLTQRMLKDWRLSVLTVLGMRVRGWSCQCVPKTAPCNRFSIDSISLFTSSLSPGCRANSCTSLQKVLFQLHLLLWHKELLYSFWLIRPLCCCF